MITLLLAIAASAATVSPPNAVLVKVGGMDCSGCEQEIVEALASVAAIDKVHASFADGAACVTLKAEVETDAITAALSKAEFTATSVETVSGCAAKGASRDPWAGATGDVRGISRGEAVKLEAHLAAGKYTIVDFGAPWCGPCYTAAKTIMAALEGRSDLAVRTVWLDKPDPKASFALPAAKQHLKWAAGLPWFIVYGPDGKIVYQGQEVEQALAATGTAK